MANPYSFDLELQSITISTSGVPFQALPTTAVLPAHSRKHIVKLSGIPLAPGKLIVRGCIVKMFSGCVEEEVVPLPKMDPKKKRLAWRNAEINVIPEQPILKVESGLESEGAVQVFEGERASFKLLLENIGKVPIRYINTTLLETYDAIEKNDDGIEQPEDIFERDVYRRGIRAFWIKKEGEVLSEVGCNGLLGDTYAINLGAGCKMDLEVGVFGNIGWYEGPFFCLC